MQISAKENGQMVRSINENTRTMSYFSTSVGWYTNLDWLGPGAESCEQHDEASLSSERIPNQTIQNSGLRLCSDAVLSPEVHGVLVVTSKTQTPVWILAA